jgi:hypothetical protein
MEVPTMTILPCPARPRKIRIRYEARGGDFRNRFVEVNQLPGDDDQTLMAKASDAYRRRFGFQSRVVAIHLN